MQRWLLDARALLHLSDATLAEHDAGRAAREKLQMRVCTRDTSPASLPTRCSCCDALLTWQQPSRPALPPPRAATCTPHPAPAAAAGSCCERVCFWCCPACGRCFAPVSVWHRTRLRPPRCSARPSRRGRRRRQGAHNAALRRPLRACDRASSAARHARRAACGASFSRLCCFFGRLAPPPLRACNVVGHPRTRGDVRRESGRAV